MIEALVQILILLLVVGLVVWLARYVVALLPIEEPFKQIANVLILLIAMLIVLTRLLPLAGVRIF